MIEALIVATWMILWNETPYIQALTRGACEANRDEWHTSMETKLRVKVSRYMSYLMRHDPEDLKMDQYGFVDISELQEKLRKRFPKRKELVSQIVEESDRRRFEIVGKKIRALYGHTIPVKLELEEDRAVKVLFHGTTPEATAKILTEGLKPMKRKWVHLSPTIGIATEVGMRRTKNPVILKIDVETARKNGLRFYRATDKVYVCDSVSSRYVARAQHSS